MLTSVLQNFLLDSQSQKQTARLAEISKRGQNMKCQELLKQFSKFIALKLSCINHFQKY